MLKFDLSFFFNKKNFNLEDNDEYKVNFKKAQAASKILQKELQLEENQILQSFTKKYQQNIKNYKKKINIKNKKKVVIGLGGSSAGSKAIANYVNEEIIFFDNLDYNHLNNFLHKTNLENYFFYIISKSGNTFETLAILNLIISHNVNVSKEKLFEQIVIITENNNNFLKKFIDKNRITFIEHNPKIGGRFSVLSETGIIPLDVKEIDISKSSEKYLNLLEDHENDLSPVKNSAIIMTCYKQKNLNIYANLLYNYRLKHFSYWFHQLHAESIGKKGQGLTPVTSICPKDHHSMMQLFIDGPKDKFFNIYPPSSESYFKNFSRLDLGIIETKKPHDLLKSQFLGLVQTLKEKKLPFKIINFKKNTNRNSETKIKNLFQLFSYNILEVIILAYAQKINPYDQPAVEQIKSNTFKI